MPLKLNSTGGGSVTLDTPSTASAYTLTVPAITGTAVVTGSTATVSQAMLASGVAGNGPAFSARNSVDQNVSNQTFTKITFGVEEFDTANCFANSTFTPNIAGYYLINTTLFATISSTGSNFITTIYKNGSAFSRLSQFPLSASDGVSTGGIIMYMNGTTDYAEIYGYLSGSGTLAFRSYNSADSCRFNAVLVRAA